MTDAFELYLFLSIFFGGLFLVIGANRRWRWLVDPPNYLWPIYGFAFIKRFFGPKGLIIALYVMGFSMMAIVLQILALRQVAGK